MELMNLELQVNIFPSKPFFANDWSEFKQELERRIPVLSPDEGLLTPVPKDAPFEIPRLLVSSRDKKIKIEIAPDKIAFFYNMEDQEGKVADGLDFLAALKELLNNEGTKYKRIGFIRKYFLEIKKSDSFVVGHFLSSKIKNKGVVNPIITFTIKKMKWEIEHNFYFRVASGWWNPNGVKKNGMLVELDINNSPDEKYAARFQKEVDLDSFLSWAAKENTNDTVINLLALEAT